MPVPCFVGGIFPEGFFVGDNTIPFAIICNHKWTLKVTKKPNSLNSTETCSNPSRASTIFSENFKADLL
jgi:hypothetical protein